MTNLIAIRTETGYTYTLTTYALKYLIEAELMFGPRTSEYEYVGVELNESGPPRVWYPHNKYIIIQVTPSTANNTTQAIFQIAHEVIHVLSPNGRATTNNLEEGLASYFSKMVTERDTGDTSYALNSLQLSKYLKPLELVENLLAIDPDSIKKLRVIQPKLSDITTKDFLDAGLQVPRDLIDELLRTMDY